MLRDTLVATIAALTVVAVHQLADRLCGDIDLAPDAHLRIALDHRIFGDYTIRGGLREAIAQLANAGATVNVDWMEGWRYVEEDNRKPIDLTLRDATLEQCLQSISFQLVERDLAYWAALDGVIHVSAPWRQRPPVATRVYDVRDLFEIESAFAAAFPRRNLDPSVEPAVTDPLFFADWGWGSILEDLGGGYTWSMRGAFGSRSGREVEIGDMDFRDGRLIVSHTPEVHRRISALLAVLRAKPNDDGILEAP